MSERIVSNEDGSMQLGLPDGDGYVMTKWYKSSLAVFDEKSFQKYLSELETKYRDNGNGQSVIRYFLSAAVNIMLRDGEGWRIPPELREYASSGQESLCIERCLEDPEIGRVLPCAIIASETNIYEAVSMTLKKHTE